MKKAAPRTRPKSSSRERKSATAVVKRNDSTTSTRKRVSRNDGWANVITGAGQKGKDKRMGGYVQWSRFEEIVAEHAYAGDKLARKIVDLPVEEALKKGWIVKLPNLEDVDRLAKRAKELYLQEEFSSACKTARLYGGAGMIVNNGDIKLGLPMTKVGSVRSVTTLNKWELYASYEDVQRNILMPGYGMPKRYTLQPRGTTELVQTKVHGSRVIRFDGEWLPQQLFRDNQYWGDSVLNGLMEAIRDYQLSNDAVANMVQDFCVAVFKIKDLAEKMQTDEGEADVINRLKIADLARSVLRAVVIDSDSEDFDHKTRPVTGIKDLLEQVEGRLVSQTPFPHTVLFGNSPSGMGGTGNHEQSNWYDFLESWRENYAKPKLVELYTFLCYELGIDPKELVIEFPPLFSADETEQANVRKTMADTDNIYIQAGVLSPEEVAKNRFSGEKFSIDTKIEIIKEEPTTTQGQLPVKE